jgi:cytochrome c556
LILTALPALAHNDGHGRVQNPEVMARMTSMEHIGKATETLSDMARGKTPLHQARARMARDTIIREAGKIPGLFEHPATDPKSDSRLDIWLNWQDFETRAATLSEKAAALDFRDRAALRTTLGQLGSSCKSCHRNYRN